MMMPDILSKFSWQKSGIEYQHYYQNLGSLSASSCGKMYGFSSQMRIPSKRDDRAKVWIDKVRKLTRTVTLPRETLSDTTIDFLESSNRKPIGWFRWAIEEKSNILPHASRWYVWIFFFNSKENSPICFNGLAIRKYGQILSKERRPSLLKTSQNTITIRRRQTP